ncbi:MAG: hypothetical protein Kow0081_2380 [Candidatus Dojkabacteria bacterium]
MQSDTLKIDNTYSKLDPRRIARVLAVCYLFTGLQAERIDRNLHAFEPQALLEIFEEKKYKKELYERIIEGVEENYKIIDEVISTLAPAWPLDQINPVDLIILRCAVWEAFIGKLTPEKVVINEAIEISKMMSSEQSKSFINGVLGKILNDKNSILNTLNAKRDERA